MTQLILVMGNSDAGKDTVAEMLEACNPPETLAHVKWSQPMKYWLENIYQIPRGSLNDKSFRQGIAYGNVTWNDLMVLAYIHLRAIDPLIMVRQVKTRLNHLINRGTEYVVMTDTRTREEVECIMSLMIPVHVLSVRGRGKAKPSDDQLTDNLLQLLPWSKSFQTIDNRGTLEELEESVVTALTTIRGTK